VGVLLTILCSSSASSQIDFKVIPSEAHVNDKVTLTIEIGDRGGQVEIQVLAQRRDSNNDGIIDDTPRTDVTIGRSVVVKDLEEHLRGAKDQNPQPKKILYELSCPAVPGEYLVQVKSQAAPREIGTRKPLVVYSNSVEPSDSEVSVLSVFPKKIRKILLSKVEQTLRTDDRDQPGQSILWIVSPEGEKSQLTVDGFAADPIWAPGNENVNRIAYSFAETADASFDIWLMNVEVASERQRITNSDLDDLSPMWSPDCTKIAFVRGNKIMVKDLEKERDEEPVVSHEGIQRILWWDAKSGSIIYLRIEPTKQIKQIWSVNIKNKRRKALTYNPLWNLVNSVAACQKSNRLLFEWKARTSQKIDIYTIDFPGPTWKNLTGDLHGVRCTNPSLSSNGDRVVFIGSGID